MPHSSADGFAIETGHDFRSESRLLSCTMLRYESAITNLTYRVGYLVHFLSACKELLELIKVADANFMSCQEQIVIAFEVARKTLESAGVRLYTWALCPANLVPHKGAYIDLLRMLQAHEHCVDNTLRKRVRVLLMPLTSTLSISEHDQMRIDKASSSRTKPPHTVTAATTACSNSVSSASDSDTDYSSSSEGEDEYMSMPPPSALVDPTKVSSRHIPYSKPRPRKLWDSHEIPTSSEGRGSRGTSRRRSTSKEQENTAPASSQSYRPPKQRFGIFLTGKSSMNSTTRKDWVGPPAH
ncbi:hypothetical protein D9619_008987 [Psilocybe cf. subviscida]|uniref:Uncharacterized protein n=1 Tax=Psilocybe cf. subviscida TaxID=2480587 RepID=A0A8H5FAH5_9AGAR|nr:hypothetical protein D9619_008987 [Psilocybe cf. subviscida]